MKGKRDDPPIIVVRRKSSGHGHHHGGSWKVAYADFVTAMMAFFLVMWIMGMDEGVRDMVQGYFNNPLGVHRDVPSGLNPVTSGEVLQVGHGSGVPGAGLVAQRLQFEAIRRTLELALTDEGLAGLGVDIELVVTDEGLRIELMEVGAEDMFFETAGAQVRPTLRQAIQVIAPELATIPFRLVVEGHTDSRPFVGRGAYSNWELSVDRANAVRRELVAAGMGEGRIQEVRGYADQALRVPEDPRAPQNRRVSLLLPFVPDLEPVAGLQVHFRGGTP